MSAIRRRCGTHGGRDFGTHDSSTASLTTLGVHIKWNWTWLVDLATGCGSLQPEDCVQDALLTLVCLVKAGSVQTKDLNGLASGLVIRKTELERVEPQLLPIDNAYNVHTREDDALTCLLKEERRHDVQCMLEWLLECFERGGPHDML
jgi:hypothetical protein